MREAHRIVALVTGVRPLSTPRRDRGAVWEITPTSASGSRVPPDRREVGGVWQLTPHERDWA